jgi:hypothetical protein
MSHNFPISRRRFLRARRNRRLRRYRRLRLFLLWLITLLALLPVLTLAGYLTFAEQYQREKTLGSAAEEHLHTALNLFSIWSKQPFELAPVRQAEQEFRTSGILMSQVESDLRALPGLAAQIPGLGTQLAVASDLVEAAQGISQAGVAGSQMLETLLPSFTNPLSGHGQSLTMDNFRQINQLFSRVKAGFSQTSIAAGPLRPDDLSFDPQLAKTFASLQHNIPLVQTILDDLTELLPVLPALLGVSRPANYLLEILDSSELRPGGGFIGSDGLLTLSGGRFESAHIQDVLLLDKKVKIGEQYIPFPPAYSWLSTYLNVPSWSLRDSNLDADFPTDALNAEQNYDLEGGSALVQGVIAITPALIQHALDITGPLAMPEYNETVTSQNLIDLIHYHQLGAGKEGSSWDLTADGQTSLRKQFTELLAEHFIDRLHHLTYSDQGKFVNLLFSSLETKDIQVYLNNPVAEKFLLGFHIASNIQAPATDSVFVVDANSAGNKANAFILTTFNDQVTLDKAGDAQHHLTLSYAWTLPGNIYGTSFYRDYLRIYVPPGSILTQEQGWQPLGSGEAFGRTFWIGSFIMNYRQTVTLNLVWSVPRVAARISGSSGWQYRYLLQHQAGTHWIAAVQMDLAACKITGVSATAQQITNAQQAIWNQALNHDTTLGVDYSCANS